MKEELLKLAEDTLTPIGWYGEKAKYIDGIEDFVEKIVKMLEDKNQLTEN